MTTVQTQVQELQKQTEELASKALRYFREIHDAQRALLTTVAELNQHVGNAKSTDEDSMAEEQLDVILRLGDLVELSDQTKAFRWCDNGMHDNVYAQVVVACLHPVVLVSPDARSRWSGKDIDIYSLRVVGEATGDVKHRVRYCLSQAELVATDEVTRLEVKR